MRQSSGVLDILEKYQYEIECAAVTAMTSFADSFFDRITWPDPDDFRALRPGEKPDDRSVIERRLFKEYMSGIGLFKPDFSGIDSAALSACVDGKRMHVLPGTGSLPELISLVACRTLAEPPGSVPFLELPLLPWIKLVRQPAACNCTLTDGQPQLSNGLIVRDSGDWKKAFNPGRLMYHHARGVFSFWETAVALFRVYSLLRSETYPAVLLAREAWACMSIYRSALIRTVLEYNWAIKNSTPFTAENPYVVTVETNAAMNRPALELLSIEIDGQVPCKDISSVQLALTNAVQLYCVLGTLVYRDGQKMLFLVPRFDTEHSALADACLLQKDADEIVMIAACVALKDLRIPSFRGEESVQIGTIPFAETEALEPQYWLAHRCRLAGLTL